MTISPNMSQATFRRLALNLLLLILVSCDMPPCKNTNPVFERYSPGQEEYKKELARQVKVREGKLRYWLDKYEERQGAEYIVVFIQGDALCAKAEILVRNWQGIEGIKRVKGRSYSGAELAGLTYDVNSDSNTTTFTYRSIDRIID